MSQIMFTKYNKSVGQLKDLNISKIAVQYNRFTAQLFEFDQRQPLDEIIRDLCNYPDWGITEASNYALQFLDPHRYVTEANRGSVKNGVILVLTYSAAATARDCIKKLETGDQIDKISSLKQLCRDSKDITFAGEFIKLKGLDILVRFINTDKYTDDLVASILISFSQLMEHGFTQWKDVEHMIIRRIIRFITEPNGSELVQPALGILDNIIQNSAQPEAIDIKFEILLRILDNSQSSELIKQNTIALINTIFQAANDQRKTKIAHDFRTKQYRDVITSSVIKSTMGNELRYQLYVLQTLLLGMHAKRMMTIDQNDIKNKLQELKRIAFHEAGSSVYEMDTLARSSKVSMKKRHKMGFQSENNIEESFQKTPPGLLPIDCLVYFAHNYSTLYKNIIAEINSTADEFGFPFGEAAIELVKLLCEFLNIGEPPCEQNNQFCSLFFSHEQPFYELFCICIETLNQTWKEMKATKHDFGKVIVLAREQITRAFYGEPFTLNDFKRIIKTFTYKKISKLHEEERASREEYESTISTIVVLKKKLTPYILDIIKKQRLNYLVEGSRFYQSSKSGQRSKNKFWYARLSVNYKTLHYGDCDETSNPPVEDLDNQINVVDIKQLLVGKDCPSAKRRGQTILKCLFAIVYLDQTMQPCDPLEFIAMDELSQNYWVDGLSVLLNLDMSSSHINNDLDTLLAMQIKLKLLDTDGFEIEKDAPPIPPDPPDYDF